MNILTAHSGSDGTKDNSFEFVDTFMAGACDAIEVDVRKNKKDVLYLSHDWIPDSDEAVKLEEVFQRIQHTSIKVNCDLKEENLEKLVFQLAKEYNVEHQIILSGTVSLEKLSKKEIKYHLFYNLEQFFPGLYGDSPPTIGQEEIASLIAFCKRNEITVINVHYRFCQPTIIKELLLKGIRISAWTVNDIDTINELYEQGVYNITTKQVLQYQRAYRKGWNNEVLKS